MYYLHIFHFIVELWRYFIIMLNLCIILKWKKRKNHIIMIIVNKE